MNAAKNHLSSSEERGKRIQFIRKHLLALSREQFCQQGNPFVTTQTLKSWELAWGSGLTEKGAKQLVDYLKELKIYCTTAWLLHGIGRQATQLTKDLEYSETLEDQIAKELLLFREQPNAIDAIISDDAMIPLLYPGNYVGGIVVKDIETAINKDCIIIDTENNTYVRNLHYGDESGHYDLVSLNTNSHFAKKEIKNISIKIAAPIVWIRRQNPINSN